MSDVIVSYIRTYVAVWVAAAAVWLADRGIDLPTDPQPLPSPHWPSAPTTPPCGWPRPDGPGQGGCSARLARPPTGWSCRYESALSLTRSR